MTLPILWTFGYGAPGTAEDFWAFCDRNRVCRVVDVRRSPTSEKPGWGKRDLEGDPRYEHRPELGNSYGAKPGQWICSSAAAADRAVDELYQAIMRGETILLLCGEADWRECHRRHVALALARLAGCGVRHLRCYCD